MRNTELSLVVVVEANFGVYFMFRPLRRRPGDQPPCERLKCGVAAAAGLWWRLWRRFARGPRPPMTVELTRSSE